MNILTLSIKQKYFDEILAGKKTHEYREIRPTNAKKYITYLCGGKEYPADAELPEEGEAELKPIKYDAIKLLTGAYTGKRPYIIVEVKNAEAVILTDENGNDIVYEHQGEEGGRLVANRRGTASATQLGSRRQRYADLRVSMGLNGG